VADRDWAMVCNDLIARVCGLSPSRFVPVCQLPQAPGERPDSAVAELCRCVTALGLVGCNLNSDPSGGWWKDPPLPIGRRARSAELLSIATRPSSRNRQKADQRLRP
jgi:predicted TIM-barrel fold metal-dependent hydrolase